MFGLLDWLKIGAGALVGASLMMPLSYHWGKRAERQDAAVAALERTTTVIREREETDVEVSASDAADLCASMGLSDEDRAECVRRVVEAIPEPRDVGSGPQQR